MPRAWGMPPTPGGRSSTRLLSVIANWPSRKNASRGSVAIQFGLPRPALRYATADALAVRVAAFARKSLISKGLKVSYSRSFKTSMTVSCSGSAALNVFSQLKSKTITVPQIARSTLPTA